MIILQMSYKLFIVLFMLTKLERYFWTHNINAENHKKIIMIDNFCQVRVYWGYLRDHSWLW